MGKLIVTTGPEFMAGDANNVLADYEGTLMLAPIHNLLPDPGFEQYNTSDQTLRYWELLFPPKPTHWAPFVRDHNTQKDFSKQVTSPLPMDQSIFKIVDELVAGPGPVDKNRTFPIAAPVKPRVKAFQVSNNVGFKEGWYTIAYGWVAHKNWKKSKLLTGPGPRSEAFHLAQGQGLLFPMPTDAPEDVHGVVVYMSKPENTELKALFSPMYAQRRFPTRNLRDFYKLTGPFKKREKEKLNNTFSDDEEMGEMDDWQESGDATNVENDETEEIEAGYSSGNERGRSKPKEKKVIRKVQSKGNKKTVLKPQKLPENAKGWNPEIKFPDNKKKRNGAARQFASGLGDNNKSSGKTYRIVKGSKQVTSNNISQKHSRNTATNNNSNSQVDVNFQNNDTGYTNGKPNQSGSGGMFDPDEAVPVEATSAEEWPNNGTSLEEVSGSTDEIDETGVDTPSSPMEVPRILDLNTSGLTPGKHHVKIACYVDDEEGMVSKFTTEKVEAGEGLKIKRPQVHNKLDNNDLGENDNQDNPEEWDVVAEEPDVVEAKPHKPKALRLKDKRPTRMADDELVKTPHGHLDEDIDKFVVSFKLKFNERSKGSIVVYLHEYDAAGTLIATQKLENIGGNTKDKVVTKNFRLSRLPTDVASKKLTKITPTTASIRIKCESKGSGRQGGKNIDGDLYEWMIVGGHAKPTALDKNREKSKKHKKRKKPPEQDNDSDNEKYEVPNGGYCVVVEDPDDGPVAPLYISKDYTDFENNTKGGWITEAPGEEAITTVGKNAAIFGTHGLRIAKLANGTSSNHIYKTYDADTKLSVLWTMHIESWSNHTLQLADIRGIGGSVLAEARIEGDGSVSLRHRSGPLLSAPIIVPLQLDDGMTISFELSVDKEFSSVELRAGPSDDDLDSIAYVQGIDWGTTGIPNQVRLGPSIGGTYNDARFDFHYDKVHVTNLSTANVQTTIANYIEYYGPHKTPHSSEYGPIGLKIPVAENSDYVMGVNAWWQDAREGSELFKVRAMSSDHIPLQEYPAMVENMTGDKEYWTRYYRNIVTPPGTAYIEFYANKLGGGKVRIHGLQVEKGTEPHRFTTLRSRFGSLRSYLSNRPVGILEDDPAVELGHVKKLRSAIIAGTDSLGLSYRVRYRSGDTFAELDAAPYVVDYTSLPLKHITEVRLDLSSMYDGKTPEIRSIELDLARANSLLCRADGSEYAGGTIAYEIGSPSEPPRTEAIELASGAMIDLPWGTKRVKTITFKLDVFRKSTAQEIMYAKEHVLETPNRRYTIVPDSPIEFAPEPGTRVYFADGREFFQRETADVTGRIISEEIVKEA